jgi:hypothetical protein
VLEARILQRTQDALALQALGRKTSHDPSNGARVALSGYRDLARFVGRDRWYLLGLHRGFTMQSLDVQVTSAWSQLRSRRLQLRREPCRTRSYARFFGGWISLRTSSRMPATVLSLISSPISLAFATSEGAAPYGCSMSVFVAIAAITVISDFRRLG